MLGFISLPPFQVFIHLLCVLTQLKFIHPELGEQSCSQCFRGSLTSILYSAAKSTLFLLEMLQQIHPAIILAFVSEGKILLWAAPMHEA